MVARLACWTAALLLLQTKLYDLLGSHANEKTGSLHTNASCNFGFSNLSKSLPAVSKCSLYYTALKIPDHHCPHLLVSVQPSSSVKGRPLLQTSIEQVQQQSGKFPPLPFATQLVSHPGFLLLRMIAEPIISIISEIKRTSRTGLGTNSSLLIEWLDFLASMIFIT